MAAGPWWGCRRGRASRRSLALRTMSSACLRASSVLSLGLGGAPCRPTRSQGLDPVVRAVQARDEPAHCELSGAQLAATGANASFRTLADPGQTLK